jgi:hypothetical protein
MTPRASIRRFDVFAEYNRLEKLAEGSPDNEAKGYGLWLAKYVAARKFGRIRPGGSHDLTSEERSERARRKFRSLGGVEQTDELFDKEIVGRMGAAFYRQVFRPAIKAAFDAGKPYKEIRDTIRQAWQVKPEKVARPAKAANAAGSAGSAAKPGKKVRK